MPTIRVVMPNGTTKSFREGTPKAVIERAKRDMVASMNETDEDHRAYRASRAVTVTQETPRVPRPFVDDIAATLRPDQLQQIMPGAKLRDIMHMADALSTAMIGMNTNQRAAFLGQIAVESGQLKNQREDLYYKTEEQLRKIYPGRFRAVVDVTPYLRNPEKLGNFVYDGINGNVPGTDDGYEFRGGGLIQTSGRANYRKAGLEDNPQAIASPYPSVDSSTKFWNDHNLDKMTVEPLDRAQFDKVTRAINGPGMVDADKRWEAYQRALNILGRGIEEFKA